jgi:hypothetical protein
MPADVTLTPAQARALDWLPGDGSYARPKRMTWARRDAFEALVFDLDLVDFRIVGGRLEWCANTRGLALRATRQPPQSPEEPAEGVSGGTTPPDASGASCGAVRGKLEGGA